MLGNTESTLNKVMITKFLPGGVTCAARFLSPASSCSSVGAKTSKVCIGYCLKQAYRRTNFKPKTER